MARPTPIIALVASLLGPLASSLGGCSGHAWLVDATEPEERAYFEVFEASTRSAALYDRLDTRALVQATLITGRFLEAYSREYARVHHLDNQSSAPWRQDIAGRFGEGIPVMVHIETPEPGHGDLDPQEGVWTTALFNDRGVSVAPFQVVRVEPSVEDGYFFPYVKSFGRTYLLRFPPRPGWKPARSGGGGEAQEPSAPGETGSAPEGPALLDGHRVTLRLAGVLGTAELAWDIDTSGGACFRPGG